MAPNHSEYDSIYPMKTLIVVKEDEDIIFRGRVITATTDFFRQKNITCEGDLAFLLDSVSQPFEYTGDNKRTIRQVFKHIVDSHNRQVENWKQFSYNDSFITVTKDSSSGVNATDEFNSTSFSDSSSALNSNLLDEYGGVLRTRTVGQTTYLDYIKDPSQTDDNYPISDQKIEFAVNLLDLNTSYPVSEIFTILLPIGKDKLKIGSVNGGSDYLENTAAVEKYGRIVRYEEWSDVENASVLLSKARRFLNEQTRLYPNDLEVKAVDLHMLKSGTPKLRLCDRVRCYSEPHDVDTILVCLAIKYDILNPQNTTYKLGSFIPNTNHKGKTNNKTSESSRGGTRSKGASRKNAQAANATDNLASKEALDNRTNIKNALRITGNQVRDLSSGETRTLQENDLLDINNNLKLPSVTDYNGNLVELRDLCKTTCDTIVAANNISLLAGGDMHLEAGQDMTLGARGSLFVHANNMKAIVGSTTCIAEDGSFSISIAQPGETANAGTPSSLIKLNNDVVEINGRKIKIGSEDTDVVSINADNIVLTGLIEKLIVNELNAETISTVKLSANSTISAHNIFASKITADEMYIYDSDDLPYIVATRAWVGNQRYGYTTVKDGSYTYTTMQASKAWITDNSGVSRYVYYDSSAQPS